MKLLVALLLFSSIVGSKFLWEGNSEYAEFLQFNKVRSSVIDHPVFRQEIIENHIIPETEFYFFSRWYFESDFPTEIQLTEKNKQLNQELLTVKQFKNSLQRLWDFQKMEAFKSFLILVMMLNFLASTKNHLGLMRFFLIWILFFVIFNHFFLLQGRVVVLFFMCFLIPLFSGFRPNFSPLIMKSTIVIFLFLLSFHSYNFLKEANGRLIMDQEFSYLNSLVNDTSPIIMEGFQEHNSEIKYSSLNQVPFLTTGWISRSPFQQKALSRFGLKSFEDIREYVLITPATNLEIVFPSYMDSIVGEFKLLDSSHTNNFVFLHFKK